MHLLKAVSFASSAALFLGMFACAADEKAATLPQSRHLTPVTDAGANPRPPFAFAASDDQLLDEVQHAAFMFLWHAAGPQTGMVPDRTSKGEVSIAGVGFQLAAIPGAVERGWVTKDQAVERVRLILKSLTGNPDNRKAGLFFHYLDPVDAGPSHSGYELVVSTIDNALLFSGIIVAAEYFKADDTIARLGGDLVAGANWAFFESKGNRYKPSERGFLTLGWKPSAKSAPTGAGDLLPYVWMDAGDEQKLTTFLGVAAPNPEHRVKPDMYFRMRRTLGEDTAGAPMFWFQWSGALFTSFFAHCFIDYAGLGLDDPGAAGVSNRAKIDWWVSSLRTVQMHRRKAIENPLKLTGLGANAWGMNASDAPTGYKVPGLFPSPLPFSGLRPEFDYVSDIKPPTDDWGDGTVAPYSMGCSIMFDPAASLSALRHLRGLRAADGKPLVWRDPAEGSGRYGFLDAFNLGANWVASDYVAIDQGPLAVSIENARTGLVWRLFHASPAVQSGVDRLGLKQPQPRKRATY